MSPCTSFVSFSWSSTLFLLLQVGVANQFTSLHRTSNRHKMSVCCTASPSLFIHPFPNASSHEICYFMCFPLFLTLYQLEWKLYLLQVLRNERTWRDDLPIEVILVRWLFSRFNNENDREREKTNTKSKVTSSLESQWFKTKSFIRRDVQETKVQKVHVGKEISIGRFVIYKATDIYCET